MLSHEIPGLPPSPQTEHQALVGQQLAIRFAHEVYHRQAFEDYCHWYTAIAEQHQQELQQMRREFNPLNWLGR